MAATSWTPGFRQGERWEEHERVIARRRAQKTARRQAQQTTSKRAASYGPLTERVRDLEKRLAKTTRTANKFAKSMNVAIQSNAKSLAVIKQIKAELGKERARTRKLVNDVKTGKRSTSSARRTIANQKRKIAGLKRQIDKHVSKFRRSTSEIRDLRREIRSLERATARARMRRQVSRPIPREDSRYDVEFPLEEQQDDYFQQLPPGWEGTGMPDVAWDSGQDWYPNDLVM